MQTRVAIIEFDAHQENIIETKGISGEQADYAIAFAIKESFAWE